MPKPVVTPAIRRALMEVIDSVNQTESRKRFTEEDRAHALAMLERLAEFAQQNAVDGPDEHLTSLAVRDSQLDQYWKEIEEKHLSRLQSIAVGESGITERDESMLRFVMATVVLHVIVGMRRKLVEGLIR